MSTLAAVHRETQRRRWPTFLFECMTVLARIGSFVVRQGGRARAFE